MPFPAGVQTVTLTAGASGYHGMDGAPYQGTIRLTPSVSRVTSAEYGVIALGPVTIALDPSGNFTEDFLAVDAQGFEPSGWTYRVDEEFTNAPNRAYNISLPAGAPVVALPSLARVESSTGTVHSPAVLSVNGETGVVDLTAVDVEADPAGTAASAVAGHLAATDAHGDRAWATAQVATRAAATTQIIAGTGLSGGGTLAEDLTLTVAFGATGTAACVGNDARLSDVRTPTAHAASHAATGADAITPAAIGAYAAAAGTALESSMTGKADKSGAAFTGALVVDRFGAPAYPLGQAGSVNSFSVPSSYAGGDDNGSGTDTTGRINLYSYQRANFGSFGENIRNFAMRSDAKTMQAFYIPVQTGTKKGGYDPATRDPMASGIGWKPVVWQGAHYEANDHASIHGHWELEIADLTGALQGRLEIPFIDQATDASKALDQAAIGVAYTNIRTNLADFSVRAQNMTAGPYSGQNTAFRVGGNNAVNKDIALSISSDMGASGRRWILRANTTTEAGSNAGTDFQLNRYDDAGVLLGTAIHIERSTGRIGMGGNTSPTAQLHVQRATGQVLYLDAQAASQSAILVNGFDATVKVLQAQVTGDTQKRFQVLVDGSQSWGPGGTTALDTTLYRGAAGRLKTDGSFHVVQNLLVNTTSVGAGVGVVGMANATTAPTGTPTGGGVLYVEAGALKFKGSSGTVTTLAPA